MTKISVLFQCHSRPHLTRLILRRAEKVLKESGYDYEFVMAYDGNSLPYLAFVTGGILGDSNIMCMPGVTRGALLNSAIELQSNDSDYFMFLEEDWYWKTMCLDKAIHLLDTGMEFVRLLEYPFVRNTSFVVMDTDGYGHMKQIPYQWNFNPHLRRRKFPAGKFDESIKNLWLVEPAYDKEYQKLWWDKTALLLGDSFVHLGVKNSTGNVSKQHYGFFIKDWQNIVGTPDPWPYVKDIIDSSNPEPSKKEKNLYEFLFRTYWHSD